MRRRLCRGPLVRRGGFRFARIPSTVVSRHVHAVERAAAAVADEARAREEKHADVEEEHRDQRAVDPRVRGETERRDEHAGRRKHDDDGRDLRQRSRAVEPAAARDAVAETARVVDRLVPVEEDLLRRCARGRVAPRHAEEWWPLQRIEFDAPDPPPVGIAQIDLHVGRI